MPSLSSTEIKQYQGPISCPIFVETGTHEGDTVAVALPLFKQIFSIELSPHYYGRAAARFASNTTVSIKQGDSNIVLPEILPALNDPVMFWLDGHWSSGNTARGPVDCPILQELDSIIKYLRPACVIAIDDVRLFGTKKNEDWSDITVDAVIDRVKARLDSHEFFPSSLHPQDRLVLRLRAQ